MVAPCLTGALSAANNAWPSGHAGCHLLLLLLLRITVSFVAERERDRSCCGVVVEWLLLLVLAAAEAVAVVVGVGGGGGFCSRGGGRVINSTRGALSALLGVVVVHSASCSD